MSVTLLPYGALLGIREEPGGLLRMPFAPGLIGAPGRLHGGTVAGLMELVAHRAVLAEVGQGVELKPINVTVDYLREGKLEDVLAAATLMKLGRRVANVRCEAWQGERDRPIAAARLNILLARPEGAAPQPALVPPEWPS
jgi:uncharacterized protein (TIGR00369 family)